MAKVKEIKSKNGEEVFAYRFNCPGCGRTHMFDQRWDFNGDLDNPTFSPSLDWTGGKYDEDGNWVDLHCHSYVEDGEIRFLDDCSHELAGKENIELPEIE